MNLRSLLEGTLAALLVATVTGQLLRLAVHSERGRASLKNANVRIAAWWVLCGAIALAMAAGTGGVIALFAVVSCLAAREVFPAAEQRAVFRPLLVFTLLQYWLVWTGRYELFTVVIPVCAFLYLPARAAVAGETEHFLERTAKACWGLTVASYCLSYVPALLMLDIRGYAGRNLTLLFYFLLVVQASDVLQYLWGKLLGSTPIAPRISPNKTWEGFLGGVATATLLGGVLYRATPFSPWQAAAISAGITIVGFAGGLIMSAIKRERGIKDFGTLVAGHGGVLDRIDSLCFSAPVFFHVVRQFYAG